MLKFLLVLVLSGLAKALAAAEPSLEAKQVVAAIHMKKGQGLSERGRLSQAEKEFDLAILSYPKGAALYGLRGQTRYERKDYLGAIQDFDKHLAAHSEDARITLLRGIAKSLLAPEDKAGACVDFLRIHKQARELQMENYCKGQPGW